MIGRCFLDTNVLVYSVDQGEPEKRDRALELLARSDTIYVLSTQILLEFYNAVVRKLERPLAPAEAAARVQDLTGFPVVQTDAALVCRAIATSREEQTSLWDALVIEAALQSRCERLLSEDLQHGRLYRGALRVENPFLDLAAA